MASQHTMAYTRKHTLVDYGLEIENEIARLQTYIEPNEALTTRYNTRWLAIKLLEEDSDIIAKLQSTPDTGVLIREAQASVAHLREIYGNDADTIIADRRYGWIHGLVKEVVHRTRPDRLTLSDKIDKVVTNRVFGMPIFLVMMWIVFKITTDLTNPYLQWIDATINGPLAHWVVELLTLIGLSNTWVSSLFIEGIIPGVGGILVFIPVLMALYAALAVLEDSGYMARAAFVMDGLMHVLGLHGKSFVPMVVGFGCTVPGLYATRTLDSTRDRVLTGLLVPFMSCSARLPVYVFLATIFFPTNSGMVVFWMYVLGIGMAVLLGLLLKDTLFREEESSPFVMELPPYRMPTFKAIWFHTWERTSAFIRKASTLILGTSVLFWLIMALPGDMKTGEFAQVPVEDSAFARIAQGITPLFKPAGFGNWQASSALLTGIVAKEVVVSTLAQVYDVAETEATITHSNTFFEDVGSIIAGFVRATWDTVKSIPLIVGVNFFEEEEEAPQTNLMVAVQRDFETTSGGHGALAALAYMVFLLLYTPCIVALAAERQELGTKWALTSALGQFILAWVVAVFVYQGGKLLGLG